MNRTGVIRRIDDLGRIVIPKEIRKTLRIKNGENLEIFVNEDENIILKKYNQIDKLKDLANELKDTIHNITKKDVIITNTESIISSNKKEYNNKQLKDSFIDIIYQRKDITKEKQDIEIINNHSLNTSFTLSPVIAGGDLVGSIILLSETINDNDKNITKFAANFLARHIEG